MGFHASPALRASRQKPRTPGASHVDFLELQVPAGPLGAKGNDPGLQRTSQAQGVDAGVSLSPIPPPPDRNRAAGRGQGSQGLSCRLVSLWGQSRRETSAGRPSNAQNQNLSNFGENWCLHTRFPGKGETTPPKPKLGPCFRVPEAARGLVLSSDTLGLLCRDDHQHVTTGPHVSLVDGRHPGV